MIRLVIAMVIGVFGLGLIWIDGGRGVAVGVFVCFFGHNLERHWPEYYKR